MTFTAKSSSPADFEKWVESVKSGTNILSWAEYEKLCKPSAYNPVTTYSWEEENLFERILMQYMEMPHGRE